MKAIYSQSLRVSRGFYFDLFFPKIISGCEGSVLLSQSYLRAASVESPLRVKVCDGSTRNVNTDQGPVDLQVDGDQQQILLKDVNLTKVVKGEVMDVMLSSYTIGHWYHFVCCTPD